MENNNEWMEVFNIDKLTDFTRRVIYHNFNTENEHLDDDSFFEKVKNLPSDSDEKEMDEILPFEEVRLILQGFVKKRKNRKTHRTKLFIKETDYDKVLLAFNERMVSNIVHKLVSRGVLDTAFDNERNDFIFWVKKDKDKDSEYLL